ILAQLYELHMSEEYYPQAKKFIPERWIPEESPFPPLQDDTYYPFSAGTRTCIIKNFVLMEMQLIISVIVVSYDMDD
ncbi:hypothetical protein BGZ76_009399, partial [Entomortierella beljakovae]